MDALQTDLQAEYCPPLDTSLLAAFIADLTKECNTRKSRKPSEQQISYLRKQLSALATLAAEQQTSESEAYLPNRNWPSDQVSPSFSDFTEDTPDWSTGDVTNTSSEASCAQNVSTNPRSPLSFLIAMFSHVDPVQLRSILARSGDNEIDMDAIVEELLTNEYRFELEERDAHVTVVVDDSIPLAQVKRKKQTPKSAPVHVVQASKKKVRPFKMALTDIKQQQNRLRSPCSPPTSRPPAAPDPWSSLTSLATHLSTLLPSRPPPFFQSAFHSPQHSSPAMALRSCLKVIANYEHPVDTNLSSAEKTQLFGLFDVLYSWQNYLQLNPEQMDQALSDTSLALRATRGNPDQALEIVEVLLDLETGLDLGVVHSPVVPHIPKSPTTKSRYTNQSPSGPPPTPPPPTSKSKYNSLTTTWKTQPRTHEWQYVPRREIVQQQNLLAESIPAYTSGRRAGFRNSESGLGRKGDLGGLSQLEKMAQLRKRKKELLLQEATRHWKKGNSGNRGGEIAMYFSERARREQKEADEIALEIARDMVMSKRKSSSSGDIIDLHGTTVSEAVSIVREILVDQPSSKTKPLTIITGRGRHSVGKVGVLKPAVQKVLVEDGWDVDTYDTRLEVRGRR